VPRIELAFGNLASGLRAALRVVEANPPVDFPLTGKLVLAQAWSRLGEHQRARAVFDALQVELPEIPSYALTQLELLWAQGRFAEARDWIETAGRAAAQDPWQHVASAQARALAGDTTGALADFAQALDGSADRDLIVGGGWLPGRTGLSSLGNWIALRKSLGQPYQDELADFVRRLDAAVAGGTNLPSIDYLRAMQCALRDDPQGADRALGTALSRGWVDPLAFEVDLAWAPYRNADWLQRQRAAQSARIAQERQKLAELLAP
jgi:tetratricopeptide (TPR) repeat protein